ncbi:hypothetical protein BSR02_08790 [Serratia liquefaciens]|nr:hypothetical protein M495_02335 [Serratia liquefaciens ATCC 27592]RYM86115.1 hypothetical protein BSR02_08790 [Serratia liquefaciens]
MFIFCYVCVILFSQHRGFESFFSGNHWSEGIYNQLINDDFLRNNYQEGLIAVMHRQISCDYSDTLQQDLQAVFLHQRKKFQRRASRQFPVAIWPTYSFAMPV